jgi:hypothetical protein
VIVGHDDVFEAATGIYPEPQGVAYILYQFKKYLLQIAHPKCNSIRSVMRSSATLFLQLLGQGFAQLIEVIIILPSKG